MTITISSDDPRTVKAIKIAIGAAQWLKCRTADGQKAYGVPSQRVQGRYYLVTCRTCDCTDAQRHPGATCKHQLAVRFYLLLLKAGAWPLPASETLDGLAQMIRDRRAAAYGDIFKRVEGD